MSWLLSVDHTIFFAINHFRNGFFDVVSYVVSLLGEYGLIWFLVAIIALIFGGKRGKQFFGLMIVAIIFTYLVNDLAIKNLLFRTRPYIALNDVYQLGIAHSNGSFASGHAANTFAAIVIIYDFYKKYFWWALGFGLLMGYSRIYNGMHYPTDVICGAFIGIGCAMLSCIVFRKIFKVVKT